jgi:hypothetical protein
MLLLGAVAAEMLPLGVVVEQLLFLGAAVEMLLHWAVVVEKPPLGALECRTLPLLQQQLQELQRL